MVLLTGDIKFNTCGQLEISNNGGHALKGDCGTSDSPFSFLSFYPGQRVNNFAPLYGPTMVCYPKAMRKKMKPFVIVLS
jgi:hypothetical protein